MQMHFVQRIGNGEKLDDAGADGLLPFDAVSQANQSPHQSRGDVKKDNVSDIGLLNAGHCLPRTWESRKAHRQYLSLTVEYVSPDHQRFISALEVQV